MAARSGHVSLWKPLRTDASGGPPSDPGLTNPSMMPGLTGWWDASGFTGMLDGTGHALSAWYQAAAGIMDRSAVSMPLMSHAPGVSTGSLTAVPRVAGMKGGVGMALQGTGLMMPALGPWHGLSHAGARPDPGGDWTWWIVWSRPNWRQGTNLENQPSTIFSVGQVPVLQIDNRGGTGRMVLFPGGGDVLLNTTTARRHTHSVVLRHSTAGGVDAWVDGVLAARGVRNPLPAAPSGPTCLLHDGTAAGAAQCWFHEAACWQRALPDSEIGSLLTYAARWPMGPRRGVTIVVNGQSNAINYALNDGAALLLAQGIAWHLGAAAWNVVASTGAPGAYTMQSGHGLYPAVGSTYPGAFLDPAGAGADPAAWPLGLDGLAVQNVLRGLSAEDLEDVRAFLWPWNETDSLRDYSEKSAFAAAVTRFLTLARGMAGKTPARLPLIWWNAIPYGSASGTQMHREVAAALAADPAMNVVMGNPQTADSNPRGSVWDPATGTASGGDAAHRDGEDNRRFARLAAPVAARAILASGQGDTVTAIPSGVPVSGGPRIAHVFRRDDTSLVLTIQHDCGTDLRVPLQAGTGIGFSVMDGGSIANPGALVGAISCQRVDATHLLITLARPLPSPSASCGLYYPYGSSPIGRGNAITDNHASVTKPAGWDMGAELGAAWNLDYPLAATAQGIPVSDAAS